MAKNTTLQKAKKFDWWKTEDSNPKEILPEEEHEPEIYCWNQISALGLSTTLGQFYHWFQCGSAQTQRTIFLDLTKSGA